MTWRSSPKLAILLTASIPAIFAQQAKPILPMVAGGAIPLYPPLVRAAKIQGVVHVRITTDGTKVVAAQAEDGHRLLAAAAEENARSWLFSKHGPMSFTVTYRYLLDPSADPDSPTVTLHLPVEVDVSIAPLIISDPPAEIYTK